MKAVRREVQPDHEHELEAAPGLPEPLPAGERVLWQGTPQWRALAVEAFHVRAAALYFLALVGLRAAFVLHDGGSAAEAVRAALGLGLLFGSALGMLLLLAWLSARTTLYTLTDRRLVLRVGIVLTLTFNLPLARLAGAGLRLRGDGRTGDIPVQIAPPDRIAIWHLWPHARPWKLATPEPMLRCVADAPQVAAQLREAWSAATATPLAPMMVPAPTATGTHDNGAQPALA